MFRIPNSKHRRGVATYPAGSNETGLLSRNGGAGDRRGFTNVLVVTTTVRVIDGVHSNTTSTRPAKGGERSVPPSHYIRPPVPVALSPVFVERTTGLEQGLVDTTTTRNNADGRTRACRDGLLCTAGETNAGLVVLGGVTDDGGVVARCACECTAVTDFLLDVGDDGTFGALAYGKDVANAEGGLLAAVNEGAGVKTFGSDECFLAKFVAIRVTEDDACERCPANQAWYEWRTRQRRMQAYRPGS